MNACVSSKVYAFTDWPVCAEGVARIRWQQAVFLRAAFFMVHTQSDVELLARLRAGDHGAFERLVHERIGPMRAAARRLLGNDADVDEVVQDAFLALVRVLSNYRGEAALGTWLHRVVINGALMRLRSRATAEEELPEELLPSFADCGIFLEDQQSWASGPLGEAMRADTAKQVRCCVDRLPVSLRTAVVLRDLEGCSNEETAELLGVTVNAAKLRVHRGRQALRSLLESTLGDCAG